MKRMRGLSFVPLLLVIGLSGCGSKTIVSGKVSYKNAPVLKGDIHFVGADGQSRSSVIADGAYTVEDPPVGTVKVAVEAVEISAGKDVGPSVLEKKSTLALAPPASTLPSRFSDPEKSNLVYEIRRGTQTINIELKD